MFNRYTITALPSAIEHKFNARVPLQYHPNFNAAPGQFLPVILNNRMGEVVLAKWGLASEKNETTEKKQGFFIRDIRKLGSSSTWKADILERRCLILADGFYIWKTVSKNSKTPYRIISQGDRLICFAGCWEIDEFRDIRFSILTRESYRPVNELAEQMPVVMLPHREMRWLNPRRKADQVFSDIEIEDWALMKYYPVSPRIRDIELNSPSLIKMVQPSDQFGNLTIFD